MASIAANLTAKVRAGYRRAQDCKGIGCSPDPWNSHDQTAHFEEAERNLYERAISSEKVESVGRYNFPCIIYTFADGSQAYMPESGYGADGMAYTLKRATRLARRQEPAAKSHVFIEKAEREPEFSLTSVSLASSYLKWLNYRYRLSEQCERDECMDPGGEDNHYTVSV